jgi:hypothetical protein
MPNQLFLEKKVSSVVQPGHAEMLDADDVALQRGYSIDHIQSLILQAAGIAEQENLPLLAKTLSIVSQLVDKCRA